MNIYVRERLRFGQADTTLSRQAEGTGLGLYLVKLLVNVLGGEISLKSEIGQGDIFTVLISSSTSIDRDVLEECNEIDSELVSSDNGIIQSAMLEFSNIYL